MAWIEPLDLRTILVNNLSGDLNIFIALSLVFFAGLAAYFRMQNEVALILIGLFFIIMSPVIGNAYLLLITLIATIMVYFAIARVVK